MVKCMSSVTPRYLADREADCRISNSKRVGKRYRVLNPRCRFDQCFRLAIVKFQFVGGHPRLNVMDALLHELNEFINLLWRGIFLQLSVISNRVMKDRLAVHNIRERCGIQNEENRSQDRSLWDFATDGHWGRATVVYSYSLISVCEVRGEPVGCSIMCAKDMFKTLEKNGMVCCIKGS